MCWETRVLFACGCEEVQQIRFCEHSVFPWLHNIAHPKDLPMNPTISVGRAPANCSNCTTAIGPPATGEEDEFEGFAVFEGGKYKKAKGGKGTEIEAIEEVEDEDGDDEDFGGVRVVAAAAAAAEEEDDDDENDDDDEDEDDEDVAEDVTTDAPLLDELLESDIV
ncbi:hypothetical protein BKA61DRAFT_585033 [Leptodontidium sp. MPI-SDFR-AT-0119]|nr:hypothetical protein BKA61DRAFT_585033 [Leptodontidium sp. MPI-SDFR-AT-0119]